MPKRRAIITIVDNEADSLAYANLRETAAYIADLSSQLGSMASAKELTLVAALLKLTTAEATRVAQFGDLAACRQQLLNPSPANTDSFLSRKNLPR